MVISIFRLETGAPFTGLQGPHESRQPGISLPSTTPFEEPRPSLFKASEAEENKS